MNIEQLKAQVAEAQAAALAKVQENAEVARLQATLKREQDEATLIARTKIELVRTETAKLQRLVGDCTGIIASMPVHNPKTRQNRVWSGSHRYTFGPQVDLVYNLATGIMYSCQEHRDLLLAHTGLDMQVIEQLVDAFGTPTYYSRNNHVVVEGKPHDINLLLGVMAVVQSTLDVVIDTSKLTTENFSLEFARAEAKAAKDFMQAEQAITEADLIM